MLQSICRNVNHFLKNEDGPTEIEYAVILGAIVVVSITIITWLVSTRTSASSPSALKSARPVAGPHQDSAAGQ